jgi:hypothetical protein
MRHKYIARYDPEDWETFFRLLKSKDYVVEEYQYTEYNNGKNKRNSEVGAVLSVSRGGEKFMAITTHVCYRTKTLRSNYRSNKATYAYSNFRLMYKLTPEGAQYIKGLIVEQNI